MQNFALREAAKNKKVRLWQLAEAAGMSDHQFSRRLRHELPPEEVKRLLALIDMLAEEKEGARC